MRRIVVVVAVAVVATLAGLLALRSDPLPEFEPEGSAVALPATGELVGVSRSEFEGMLVGQEGRPVVVNVWASWCGPCRAEMPLLQAAADAYGDEAVILGVAANDDPDAARAFLADLDITYPNTFDTSGDIHDALQVRAFPSTYVFGADGTLRARVIGGISEQRLAGLVEDALR